MRSWTSSSWILLPALIAALLPGCRTGPAEEAALPFRFIVLADPQMGMFEENRAVTKEVELLDLACAEINARRPAFVVVCGDLVNVPGNEDQAAALLRAVQRIDPAIPIHWVAGNHDVGNDPEPASIEWFWWRFGPDRYSWEHGGWKFVVIDSCIVKSPGKVPGKAEAQWTWLERELREARDRGQPVVVFQHHPLFLSDPTEDDQYFNVSREERKRHLDLFRECGVEAVFAGHYHRNAWGRDGRLEMVTTAPVGKPLGTDPSGFRLVTVFRGGLLHAYVPLR